jgi:hypothetical protein
MSVGEGDNIVFAILFLVAANSTRPGDAGEHARDGRLDDRGRPVPAGDELLEAVALDAADDLLRDELGFGDYPLQGTAAET